MTQLIAKTKAEQSYSAIDPWTVVHFAAGLGAGLLDINFWLAESANVGYEVAENVVQRMPVGQSFFRVSHPENTVNSLVDIGVFTLGWWLGRRWNGTI